MSLTRAPVQPVSVDTMTADGVFIKQITVEARDTVLPQHAHKYPHTSFVATGAVRVWVDGKQKGDYHAPTGILIPAGIKHMFLTLKDDTTILCIHNGLHPDVAAVLEEHQLDGIE